MIQWDHCSVWVGASPLGSPGHDLTVSLLGSKDTPVEKKKKGKRKNETPVNSLDLDQDLLSPSVQSPEESAESADSQVCPKPSAGCWWDKS